jgi:hypothetical protein
MPMLTSAGTSPSRCSRPLVFRNAFTDISAGMNDPGLRDLSAASDLLKPFDAGPEAALSRERPRINRVENDHEECARARFWKEKSLM